MELWAELCIHSSNTFYCSGISSGRGGSFSSAPPAVVPAATVTTASITVQATPTPPAIQQSSTSSLPQATSTTTSLPGMIMTIASVSVLTFESIHVDSVTRPRSEHCH